MHIAFHLWLRLFAVIPAQSPGCAMAVEALRSVTNRDLMIGVTTRRGTVWTGGDGVVQHYLSTLRG